MEITVVDGSNYFRGLLLLIRKDHRITETEIHVMKRIGRILGYESAFCDNAINEIMENTYIADAPPEFSTQELARKFVKDGLALAFSDGKAHPLEEGWLMAVAEKNGLDPDWFRDELTRAMERKPFPVRMEIDDLSPDYF